LSYSGNLLVENRNGLIMSAEVFEANGTAERDAALLMLEQIPGTKPLRPAEINMTRRTSWPSAATSGSHPTWHKTISAEVEAPSTHGPPVTRDMPSVNGRGSASKNVSDG
jgi:hypothetical protein